jgi:phenylacetate-CoA ligase
MLAGGNILHPRVVWSVFRRRPEVLRYQLFQEELDRFELRLVTETAASFDRIAQPMMADLRSLLGPVHIELARCEELPPAASGKFRPVVSRIAVG